MQIEIYINANFQLHSNINPYIIGFRDIISKMKHIVEGIELLVVTTNEKVCLYIRKSREDENKGEAETLYNQRESLIRLAESKGYKYEIFEEVESSVDFNRPELVRMLTALDTGSYTKILCTKIDRIGRETSILSEVKKICVKHNILIETPSTVYDLKEKNQKMMYNFSSLIAEAEYDEIRERLARGKVNSVQLRNRWIGSTAPFGYIYDKNKKKLKYHPEHSKVFRNMVELALEGYTFSEIAATLNDKGHRTQNNNRWTAGRIQKILKNKTYLGHAEYNSTTVNENAYATDCHDALMTEDEQRMILTLSGSRKTYDNTRNWGKTKTVLDGLVFCGECHRGMSIQISKKKSAKRGEWSFYQARRCIHYNQDGVRCSNHGCKIDILEKGLIEYLNLHKQEIEERIIQLENEDKSGIFEEISSKISDVEDSIKKQENKINKLTDIYLDGDMEKDEYNNRKKNLIEQKQLLENDLNYLKVKLKSTDTKQVIKEYKNTLKNIEIFLNENNPIDMRNKSLKTFLSRLELSKETQYSEPIVKFSFIQ